MPKPQPNKEKFWEELEALLVEEKPGPEWFTIKEACTKFGTKHTTTKEKLSKLTPTKLETKQFKIKSHWVTFYRVKK